MTKSLETKGSDKRDFDALAATWDENPLRVHLAHSVTDALFGAIPLDNTREALDYGAGTGLVTLALASRSKSVCAADSSVGMLDKLKEKAAKSAISNITTTQLDLDHDPAPLDRFDLVVSTMTLHHITDAHAMIGKLAGLLWPGGWLAIADLDLDDGDFHADPTGVRHNGFDRSFISQAFIDAGLSKVKVSTACKFTKDVEGKATREFSIFLAVGCL